MMVLSIGVSKGRLPGIVFGLGCALGCLSHTLLAAVGISALIAASSNIFTIIKICGGLYLIWIGFNVLRHSGGAPIEKTASDKKTLHKLFLQGLLANAINPKIILFFLSFLPQFVVPQNGSVSGQIAWLGLIFTLQAAVIFALLGYFSGSVGQYINKKPRVGKLMTHIAGIVFVGLGLRLIVGR